MDTFPYAGYVGKYLRVNLTTGDIKSQILPKDWVEKYLGGNGIGTKILWDEVSPDVEPFSPENRLIMATGPLCGGPMPNTSRIEFIAKSPLTGIYGDSNAGGCLGPELKFAGYDLVVFEGCASSPVYLLIQEDRVELHDAAHLWGLGGYETEATLQKQLNDVEIKTAVIGQAGENLVRYASIMVSFSRHAARSGMGAVMGSKRLKPSLYAGRRVCRCMILNLFAISPTQCTKICAKTNSLKASTALVLRGW